MKRLAVLFAALLLPAILLAGQLPAQGAPQTRVVANCTHLAVKPHRIVVACADFGIYVVARHYQSWTRSSARGTGVYWFNDCKPSCAGGTFHHYPAHLRLGRVVKTRRGPVFSRMVVRYDRHHQQHRVAYSLPTRPL